jgi:hypothetical protein
MDTICHALGHSKLTTRFDNGGDLKTSGNLLTQTYRIDTYEMMRRFVKKAMSWQHEVLCLHMTAQCLTCALYTLVCVSKYPLVGCADDSASAHANAVKPSRRMMRFDSLGEDSFWAGVFITGAHPIWLIASR